MNLVSGTPGADSPLGSPQDRVLGPTARPEIVRGTNLQLNNLGEQINRATDAFTRLLGEVSKAVGRYGSVQLENLQQMPIFPEPIRALMGMLSKSPEALASQLNRMIPNHTANRQLANGQTIWVDATNAGDRTLLGQLATLIDRFRGTANGPAIGAFFSQLNAAVGTNTSITLADVVTRARALVPSAPTTAPAGSPAPVPAGSPAPLTVAPASTPTEIVALGTNETLRVGEKRTIAVPFATDVTIEGQPGRLSGSTAGSATINGLKLTRNQDENTVTIEVATGARAGARSVKFGSETRILTIRSAD
ncbi:MAG: hypothetical protein KBC95_00650 [Candidatus Peribacteraceae bacterium]|nr:hypothetical protein [Candidatus Peribacteraceae bacterium]